MADESRLSDVSRPEIDLRLQLFAGGQGQFVLSCRIVGSTVFCSWGGRQLVGHWRARTIVISVLQLWADRLQWSVQRGAVAGAGAEEVFPDLPELSDDSAGAALRNLAVQRPQQ